MLCGLFWLRVCGATHTFYMFSLLSLSSDLRFIAYPLYFSIFSRFIHGSFYRYPKFSRKILHRKSHIQTILFYFSVSSTFFLLWELFFSEIRDHFSPYWKWLNFLFKITLFGSHFPLIIGGATHTIPGCLFRV